MNKIGEKIRTARIKLKKTAIDFADTFNISYRTYQSYERGERSIPHDLIAQIVQKYNISLDYIYGCSNTIFKDTNQNNQNEFTKIPKCSDVSASLGSGKEVFSEEVTEQVVLPKSMFKKISANPKHCCIINTDGSSMYPTIIGGQDMIMIDTSQKEVFDGRIYLIRMDNSLFCKRLQKLPNNQLKVISDNPKYDSYTLDLNKEDLNFAVIGRVVWISRPL